MLKKLEITIRTGEATKLAEAMVRICNLKLPIQMAATTKSTVLSTIMRVRGTNKLVRRNPSLSSKSLKHDDDFGEDEDVDIFLLGLPIFTSMIWC